MIGLEGGLIKMHKRADYEAMTCGIPNFWQRRRAAKLKVASGRRCTNSNCRRPLSIHNPYDLCFACFKRIRDQERVNPDLADSLESNTERNKRLKKDGKLMKASH